MASKRTLVSLLALAALAVPAQASAAEYRGRVVNGGGDDLSFQGLGTVLASFMVSNIEFSCGEDGTYVAPTLGFREPKVSDSRAIRADETIKANRVRYRTHLRGRFTQDYKRASGTMKFEARGKLNGTNTHCRTKSLRWKARLKSE